MSREVESYLNMTVTKLERLAKSINKEKGYTKDTENIKMLYELVKEQIQNENTHNTVSSSR